MIIFNSKLAAHYVTKIAVMVLIILPLSLNNDHNKFLISFANHSPL
jgi:hypothetical protein